MSSKKTKFKILMAVFIIFIISVFISCNWKSEQKEKDEEYTVSPIDRCVFYGIDIKKIMNMKFSEIEKVFGTETQIDKEVEVVFIEKEKDFVKKSQATEVKDHIDIIYGPVRDLTIYGKYKEIFPYTITFHGRLSINEKIDTKSSIIKEIEKNLPKNDTTKKIFEQIKQKIVVGIPNKGSNITIKFEMPEFPVAEFYVGFFKDEITYKYTFSKMKEIYP